MTQPAPPSIGSSRDSLAGAGWDCRPGDFQRLMSDRNRRPFSWLKPSTLWRSRNDVVAHRIDDPTNDERRRWLAAMYPDGTPDLVVDRTDVDELACLIVGDPGEGDASQYAVVPRLLAQGDVQFMFICSDVIYPAGGANEYEEKFYRPYRDFPGPIYAIPGNHDWYDNLTGFMLHFCRRSEAPAGDAAHKVLSRPGLRKRLWRRPAAPDVDRVQRMRGLRSHPSQQSTLPGPYFVVDAGPLQLVAIDTGIRGDIDHDQGVWLKRISRSEKPKILLTGKPLIADGTPHPGPIEGGGTVDSMVRDPANRYLAAIGGDVHNYQRYPVKVCDRIIQYIVSGGGGAFMHATHKIPRVSLPYCEEEDFRCYPLRGDSLSFYSKAYDRRLAGGRGRLYIPPAESAALMGEMLDIVPSKHETRATPITDRSRRAAARVFPLKGGHRGLLQPIFSEFFDWNDPPLFKSFLRLDASRHEVRIKCIAASGCVGDGDRPPEDEIVATATEDSYAWAI